VTVAKIPDEMKSEFDSQGKEKFFEHWAEDIHRREHVDGVVILLCKEPGHFEPGCQESCWGAGSAGLKRTTGESSAWKPIFGRHLDMRGCRHPIGCFSHHGRRQ